MADIKYNDATAIKTCLNTATEGTTLNALAGGSIAISNTTGDLDNGTDLDLWGDLELLVDIQVALAVGDKVAELYIVPSVDDTNFMSPDDTGDTPQAIFLVGVFECRDAVTTDQRMAIVGVPLPPRKMRFVLKNVSGQTFGANDGHFLKCKPYKLQSV